MWIPPLICSYVCVRVHCSQVSFFFIIYLSLSECRDLPSSCLHWISKDIALLKALFSVQKYWYFSYFSTKTYIVGTHQKHLGEALLMSTHNICFRGEIRKIITWYALLSRPMKEMIREEVFELHIATLTYASHPTSLYKARKADSRRRAVSCWWKNVHKYWLTT